MYKSTYIVITARDKVRFRVQIESEHPAAEFQRRYAKWVEPDDEIFVKLGGQWILNYEFSTEGETNGDATPN